MSGSRQELENLAALTIKGGASDLHLVVGHRPIVRVSGNLLPLVKLPELTPETTRSLLEALVNSESIAAFDKEKELDFSYHTANGDRFRGNAYISQGDIAIALRLIPREIQSIEELNLPPGLVEISRKKQGFFLVVGPVGHGKSTTLASIVQRINIERAEHILTIEDPVEHIFPKGKSIIDQREVRFDTHDFHVALRSMFRQDVNVVMIGEMRGQETVSTAVTAAETGHLVLSTLHTNNAAQTIDRIIDSFPGAQQAQIKVQLAGSLLGIFSQRLIPRISGGRIPAYEVLLNNAAVANLIREGRTHEINIVLETGSSSGMTSMNSSIASLVRAGEITADDAMKYTLNPRGLQRLL